MAGIKLTTEYWRAKLPGIVRQCHKCQHIKNEKFQVNVTLLQTRETPDAMKGMRDMQREIGAMEEGKGDYLPTLRQVMAQHLGGLGFLVG